MLFVYPITTTKNTLQSSPVMTRLPIQPGTIVKMNVQYPSGLLGLVHLQVQHGLHQLFPTNADQDLATSNETISWEEEETIDQPPFELVATTWNLDTVNDHTITIRIVMKPLPGNPDIATQIAALLAPPVPPGA